MSGPMFFDRDGRRIAYRRGPHARLLLPALVLVVIGTSGGAAIAAKAAGVVLLVVAVLVWIVRPVLDRGDR